MPAHLYPVLLLRVAGRDGPGAASPGRALQGVKDKLTAFMAKQQQGQPAGQQRSPRQQGELRRACLHKRLGSHWCYLANVECMRLA
jgi:hypothetical protein